jgi:hypothetical protein
MKYTKPNFNEEWSEALRYREFEKMGKKGWLEVAQNNFEISNYDNIKGVLSNIDLDFENLEDDKKKRFEEAFEKGEVEIPIVVKFSDTDYDLLGGNTRLSGLLLKGINPKLWVVDLTEKNKPMEVDETDSGSSGSFEGPLMGGGNQQIIRKKITSIPNMDLDEVTDASSSGSYDVPAFGTTSKGRKNPLKIDGPDSIYKGRAVKDKNFPKWGGPDSVFVKVKEKCKKYPYCNQGNTGAIEFVSENKEIKDTINEISKKYGISYKEIEKIVLNDINKIFI